MPVHQGLVVKSTGSWYQVLSNDGKNYPCIVRGKFRLKEGPKPTNPVAVGDKVKFQWDESHNAGQIIELEDRKNYLIRKASNLSKQVHIIAANIDIALLLATISSPRTSQGFIDRFLVTTEAYDVPRALVFNKIDLYNHEDKERLDYFMNLYETLGYKVLTASAKNGFNLEKIKDFLQGKVSILVGHSGTGKSSILNQLFPKLALKTSDISTFSGKGKHTTTFAEMHKLNNNTFIVDTPGIREFGLVGFELYEISHFFPEMEQVLGSCKFSTCLHINEPGCAVRQGVDNGEIDAGRYKSYLNILDSIRV